MDNQTIMQYFEWNLPPDGLLWQRVAAQAKNIREIGIDIVWLPPAYKGGAGMSDVGYGVYDTYDLGEFDQKGVTSTKYGTRREYLKAIRALQRTGITVLADIVLNHRMGADASETVTARMCNPDNRNEIISDSLEVEAWTKFTFPGRKGKYSKFEWNWTCFTGIDYDAKTGQTGIYLFDGKKWSEKVTNEKGNYDFLMGVDVDVNAEHVFKELVRWGCWYVKTTKVDGFRLDALKHIDCDFYQKWLDAVRKASDRELFTVGEYWSPDVSALKAYLNNLNYRVSLFDVPLHMNFATASHANGQYDMGKLFENTLISEDTQHTVTFVDNHDSQPGQSLESWVEDWFKPLAYAAILLRKDGLPCVFYADYYGLRSDGEPAVPGIVNIVAARKHCAYGEQHDYFDHHDIVGWTREGDKEHKLSGCAVLMSDGPEGEKTMYVGKQFANKNFRDLLRRFPEPITIDSEGNGVFKTKGGSVSLWVREEMYEQLAVAIG